jgi:hypothetical protein
MKVVVKLFLILGLFGSLPAFADLIPLFSYRSGSWTWVYAFTTILEDETFDKITVTKSPTDTGSWTFKKEGITVLLPLDGWVEHVPNFGTQVSASGVATEALAFSLQFTNSINDPVEFTFVATRGDEVVEAWDVIKYNRNHYELIQAHSIPEASTAFLQASWLGGIAFLLLRRRKRGKTLAS